MRASPGPLRSEAPGELRDDDRARGVPRLLDADAERRADSRGGMLARAIRAGPGGLPLSAAIRLWSPAQPVTRAASGR